MQTFKLNESRPTRTRVCARVCAYCRPSVGLFVEEARGRLQLYLSELNQLFSICVPKIWWRILRFV